MATPMALPPAPLISSATASAPLWLRSAIATAAPACASVSAICLPMPLAAPVTTATLPSSFVFRERDDIGHLQVVEQCETPARAPSNLTNGLCHPAGCCVAANAAIVHEAACAKH